MTKESVFMGAVNCFRMLFCNRLFRLLDGFFESTEDVLCADIPCESAKRGLTDGMESDEMGIVRESLRSDG